MNDGSLDYKNYHSVDSLAFGHCDYSYRNLGRPSKLQIRQEGSTFEVIIDAKLCMSTDKVHSLSRKLSESLLTVSIRSECLNTTTLVSLLRLRKTPILSNSTNSCSSPLVRLLAKNLAEHKAPMENNPISTLIPHPMPQLRQSTRQPNSKTSTIDCKHSLTPSTAYTTRLGFLQTDRKLDIKSSHGTSYHQIGSMLLTFD